MAAARCAISNITSFKTSVDDAPFLMECAVNAGPSKIALPVFIILIILIKYAAFAITRSLDASPAVQIKIAFNA